MDLLLVPLVQSYSPLEEKLDPVPSPYGDGPTSASSRKLNTYLSRIRSRISRSHSSVSEDSLDTASIPESKEGSDHSIPQRHSPVIGRSGSRDSLDSAQSLDSARSRIRRLQPRQPFKYRFPPNCMLQLILGVGKRRKAHRGIITGKSGWEPVITRAYRMVLDIDVLNKGHHDGSGRLDPLGADNPTLGARDFYFPQVDKTEKDGASPEKEEGDDKILRSKGKGFRPKRTSLMDDVREFM